MQSTENSIYVRWSEYTPEKMKRELSQALKDSDNRVKAITRQNKHELTFDSTLLALEGAIEPLQQSWGFVLHLDAVKNSDELRVVLSQMLPKVTRFFSRLYLNQSLWKVIKAYSLTEEARALTGEKKRFLAETLADFRENGAGLSPDKKERLEQINTELAEAAQKYSENVLDATNAWELILTEEKDLAGLPKSAREAARQSAREKKLGTEENPQWRFTLQQPSYLAIIQYLDNQAIRQKACKANMGIGRKAPFENEPLILEILKLRHEKAQILGKENFADFILERRMVKKAKHARTFIEELYEHAKGPFAEEMADLERYQAEKTHSPITPFEPWDLAYWEEKCRRERFHFDEEELRPYFPMEQVLKGLFHIAEKIYGITITPHLNSAETWHPEVEVFDVYDEKGQQLGAFYTDWHPRTSKRSGAWMLPLITGKGGSSPHLGAICGNLSPPLENQPALLTHEEVRTIFHEFGHLLHHLLGHVSIKSLNGTAVALDFVELPSQIMENWCWEKEGLQLFARHWKTGEVLPDSLLEKMIKARNYRKATDTMRQLSLGKLDLDLHIDYACIQEKELETFLQKRLEGYLVRYKTPVPTMVCRFSHIFGDPTGYAAGYYSYKWAEVLDADAFTRFKQEGILNPNVGREFREKILNRGNSAPPDQLFYDFMGREPNIDALLERSGLKK